MNIPVTHTTREMKKNNIALVTTTLKALGTATKGDLALQTGLSSATCGAILNELSLTGELLALELEASRGGRPAQRYACNPEFFSLLSLYAAGSDEDAQLVWSLSSAVGDTLAGGEMPFHPLTPETFHQLIDTLLRRWPNIAAIGIGLPGVVVDGVVTSCDISLFSGLAIVKDVAMRTGRFVEAGNDINFTVWGFYRSDCAGVSAPVAYIYKPDVPCTGCGMVINGQVLHGANDFAGEVSRLPFQTDAGLPLIDEMAKIVISLAALINPVKVALGGTRLKASHLHEIRERCLANIPAQHLPKLVYREEIRQDYLQGISELTLKNFLHYRLFTSPTT